MLEAKRDMSVERIGLFHWWTLYRKDSSCGPREVAKDMQGAGRRSDVSRVMGFRD